MKAVLISRPGGPEVLEVAAVEDPRPSPADLLVEVRTTALNRADLLQRRGLYPPPAGVREDIPGLEFAGVVSATGAEVRRFKAGDRVMGLLPGGGYAEKIATPEGMALSIPEGMGFEQAAAIPEAFLTAWDALARLGLREGESLLVHAAASGVGTAAIQLARHARAGVLGTAGSDEKLARAQKLGLGVGINRSREDFACVVRAETRGRGVDAIMDFVGGDYWQRNLSCLAEQGRLILLGLLSGARAGTDLSLILRKRLTIIGTVLRPRSLDEKIGLSRDFEARLMPLFETGELRPVVDRVFDLEEAAAAHRCMEENRNFGKIVLRVSG